MTKEKCLGSDVAPITHQVLLRALTMIIQKYSTMAPRGLTRALQTVAVLMAEANDVIEQHMPAVEALTHKLGDHIENSVHKELEQLSADIKGSLAEQQKTCSSSTDTLIEAVNSLKQIAVDLHKSVNDATAATMQILDMAITYKEALLNTTTQLTQILPVKERPQAHIAETGMLCGIEKKARQILLDLEKGEDNGLNIYKIKEKARVALASLTPLALEGTEIQEVIKLRNGSVILQFTTKETADWLRIPTNKRAFTRKFDPDVYIRDHIHLIMVPRIPLTFDPSNPVHLREIEETNRMPKKLIKRARWIKPEYRCVPNQSCAHTIFTITSTVEANKLLKDGIYICNTRTFPKKLKYEPKQCMKCRRWGHYTASCRTSTDTCGTCRDQHKTRDYKVENKRYCVSCKSDTHASWDRNCPEFLWKCDKYSRFHPENHLIYLPTDEDWTLTVRPEKIPMEDKFPAKFTVGSLSLPSHTQRQLPTCPIGRRSKRANQNSTSQAVMENYFGLLVRSQTNPNDTPPARVDDNDEDYDTQFQCDITDLPANFLQIGRAHV